MNSKKKKRFSGNLLDIVLIFLFVLSAALVLFRWKSQKSVYKALEPFVITVSADSVQPQIVQCISVGESVYNATGERIGEIKEILTSGTKKLIDNGESYVLDTPAELALLELKLEITTVGTLDGERFLQGGRYAMLPGDQSYLYTQRTGLLYLILDVEEQENNLT